MMDSAQTPQPTHDSGTKGSDAMLVVAARAGDADAWAELVGRYFGTVWAIAYARLSRPDAADDLAQEVFLMAVLHLESLSDPDRLAGWLSQITHHRAVNWLRQKRNSSRLVAMVPVEHLAQETLTAEPVMEQEEQRQAVREAVFTLPPDQREIVLLHFAEGLNQKEIADRLGVHPGTVGRQLHKALSVLRQSLEPLVAESLAPMRAPRQTAARTAVLVAAVVAMPAAGKAALVAAGGGVPPLAAVAGLGTAANVAGIFGIGATLMTTTKTVIAVAAILVLGAIGAVVYATRPGASPQVQNLTQPAPGGAQPASVPAADDSELQAILAARDECFPPAVVAYMTKATPEAAKLVDPTGQAAVITRAFGVDHNGTRWLGTLSSAVDNGSGRLEFGNTGGPGLVGVITPDQRVIRMQFSPNPPGSWGPYRMWIPIADVQPGETQGTFGIIMRAGVVHEGEGGAYECPVGEAPGPEGTLQLWLVTPPAWRVRSSSQAEETSQAVGTATVHLWQKHVAAEQQLMINVQLERRPTTAPSQAIEIAK